MLKLMKFEVVLRFQASNTACCDEGPVVPKAKGVTVTLVEPRIFLSDWLVAVMVIQVAEDTIGAVNKPKGLTCPAVDDHVTAGSEVLLRLALNCRFVPETSGEFGEGVVDVTLIV